MFWEPIMWRLPLYMWKHSLIHYDPNFIKDFLKMLFFQIDSNIKSTWTENIHQVGKTAQSLLRPRVVGESSSPEHQSAQGATESWLRLLRAGPAAKICPSGSYSTSGNLWGWQRWCSSRPEGVAPTWVVTNECHLLKDNPCAKSHAISPTPSYYATDPMEICPGSRKWLGYFG